MWNLPRPGLEPVSPALAGRFSTTAPPGKPSRWVLNHGTTREVPQKFKNFDEIQFIFSLVAKTKFIYLLFF